VNPGERFQDEAFVCFRIALVAQNETRRSIIKVMLRMGRF
jgi:hypothetical protein